jgi:ketosteroid isomerase-like protein
MRTALAITAVALAFGARAAEPEVILHGPSKAVDEIVAAERFYSDHVGAAGIARGMSEYIDPKDGLAVTEAGDPARGPAVFAAFGGTAPQKLKMSWTPVEVFAAQAGDMGASRGRFRVTSDDAAARPVTGRYVAVWRKGVDGKWKAIMDIGNPDGG